MIRHKGEWYAGWRLACGLAGLLVTVTGCTDLFPSGQPVVGDLETAQVLADAAAKNWDANARLIGLTAVWVDENGRVGEPADNPGWGFQYVDAAGTQQLGISVEPDGNVGLDGPFGLAAPITKSISAHTNEDIEDYIDAAEAELLKLPADQQLGTGTVDIVVIVGFNQEDGSEDATVLFHEEDEQGTAWAEFDWVQLFRTADAYVFLDTATRQVESNSWNMSFARALRLATANNGDYNRLVGILAVWVNEDVQLEELTADQPGWGFQFVNDAGTQRIGVTVDADGAVIVFPAETLATPQLRTLSQHAVDDLQDYVTVAQAELTKAPAGEQPTTPTIDIAVLVGFSQVDNSEEACVMFHDEADQGTDWATINWFNLFLDAEAYVFVDTATNTIENISWD